MHTVFLSQPVMFKEYSPDLELSIIHKLAKKHKKTHFDRLPSCPSCLDKLDNSVTGL
jgi:hypothetical protein